PQDMRLRGGPPSQTADHATAADVRRMINIIRKIGALAPYRHKTHDHTRLILAAFALAADTEARAAGASLVLDADALGLFRCRAVVDHIPNQAETLEQQDRHPGDVELPPLVPVLRHPRVGVVIVVP